MIAVTANVQPAMHRSALRPARRDGFTLIELMVVLTIIAVITGMVALRLGGRSREVQHEREARRMQQAITLAAEEAIIQGRQYGLAVTARAYRFCRREQGRWKPIESDRALYPYTLPENLALRIESDLPDPPPAGAEGEDEGYRCPMVRMFPSGEAEPLQLTLRETTTEQDLGLALTVTGKVARVLATGEENGP